MFNYTILWFSAWFAAPLYLYGITKQISVKSECDFSTVLFLLSGDALSACTGIIVLILIITLYKCKQILIMQNREAELVVAMATPISCFEPYSKHGAVICHAYDNLSCQREAHLFWVHALLHT